MTAITVRLMTDYNRQRQYFANYIRHGAKRVCAPHELQTNVNYSSIFAAKTAHEKISY